MARRRPAAEKDARGGLKLFTPVPAPTSTGWRINGFRARLFVWDRESWSREAPKPADAQPIAEGYWGAIRVE